MKKSIFLLVLIVVLTLFIAGCTSTMKEPPAISVSVASKEIEYVSAKNKWNGSVYDREDTFVTILKERKDIPIFENGSIAEITFKSNPPDEFKIMDILIDENGRQIYTDKEIINIPVELINGKYSFEIEKHLASFLSSHYEPEKKDIRGFRMIASWGENECEYAFIIKTYSAYEGESDSNDEIDRTEFYSLFDKAREAWGWFYVWTMPLKGTPGLPLVGIETESGTCFEVDYEGIETLEDLENYLKTIFTDEKVEGMLKSGRYFDVDGKLCAIDLARGTNHSYGKIAEVNKNAINENQIEYVVSVEKLDYNYELEGYEEFTFVTEKNGDFWVFSKFPAWW